MTGATAKRITASYIDQLHLKPRLDSFGRERTVGKGDAALLSNFSAALPKAQEYRFRGEKLESILGEFSPDETQVIGIKGENAQETADAFLASLPQVPKIGVEMPSLEIGPNRPSNRVTESARYTT